jgi:hypothetical protein
LNEVAILKRQRDEENAEGLALQQQAARRFEELQAVADQGIQALDAVEQNQRALKKLQQEVATLSDNNTGVADVLLMVC